MKTTSGFETNENIILSKEESKVPIGSEVFGLSIKRAEEINNLVERALNGDLEELNGRDETEGSIHKIINYVTKGTTTPNELAYAMYTLGFQIYGVTMSPLMSHDPLSELLDMLNGVSSKPDAGDTLN